MLALSMMDRRHLGMDGLDCACTKATAGKKKGRRRAVLSPLTHLAFIRVSLGSKLYTMLEASLESPFLFLHLQ